ncbi:MAG TPA: type II 3-dehydroquinate dehydratase [Alphaproteobacteria bacterium]
MSAQKTILVLIGPNLNMVGLREPAIYGTTTHAEIVKLCHDAIEAGDFKADVRQSNYEGDLVTWIQDAFKDGVAGVVINAGAYTHTSIAIHDALRLLSCPIAEVHMSNPKEREPFRHISYVEPLAALTVVGQGAAGYKVAIDALISKLN